MTTHRTAALAGHTPLIPLWLALVLIAAAVPDETRASTSGKGAFARGMFDMAGSQVIQDEEHLGIANGQLTAGINYRDVAGIAGLWAPPYVSANFTLDLRVQGAKVPTSRWTWRPFEVEREGRRDGVSVTSTTTLIHGTRAAVVTLVLRNSGRSAVPVDLFAMGWLDKVQEWGFARPGGGKEATPQVQDGRLLLRQGTLAVALGIGAADWTWEASGNLGHASSMLPPRQSRTVSVVLSLGEAESALSTSAVLLTDPSKAVEAARDEHARQVSELSDRLPRLESDNAQLVRWYERSLVHLVLNRWQVPEFVLHPYYSTGSIKGGCVANYLWNFGEVWEILPLFDPAAARTHIKQFLGCDLLKHFLFNPITGASDGVWYMINQEKIIGLAYYYVLLTGDTAFLDDTVDGKSLRDHMVIQAMFGDDLGKPVSLIDYGPSNSHLELRRRFGYRHVMPDLNARRYANYLRAATLCELAGKPAPFLRERAAQLRPLLRAKLWDAQAQWFRYGEADGRTDLRYTVQMFKPIGSGVLDPDVEAGLLSHLNEKEFLSRDGLHSISKLDPAYDQFDIDNGGGGICTSFPPQIIERLYQADKPQLAGDILGRLLWWADAMPYWGDSIAANCRDYRRDTPLQCTLDGAAAAQCVIFGVFGISVTPAGEIRINPHALPFTRRLALEGLKVRGQSLSVAVNGTGFTVTTRGRTQKSLVGQPIVLPARP